MKIGRLRVVMAARRAFAPLPRSRSDALRQPGKTGEIRSGRLGVAKRALEPDRRPS
jgi:hypothetical protein